MVKACGIFLATKKVVLKTVCVVAKEARKENSNAVCACSTWNRNKYIAETLSAQGGEFERVIYRCFEMR